MTRVRVGVTLIVALAIFALTGCDHYNCSTGATFGGGCSAGGGGVSQGSGGTGNGNNIVALAYYVSNNQIGSLALESTGSTNTLESTPNFVLETLPTGYLNSAIVIAQQQFLYVPYASTSASPSLYAWTIDGTTGAVTAISGSPFAASFASGLASSAQPLTPMVTNSAGTFLYVADTLDSQIDVFQISSSGVPTLFSQTPAVIPPWNLAMDGLGRFLYASEATNSGEGVQMSVYSINQITGALSGGTPMAFNMWQVQGEPLGKFMFGVDGQTGLTGDNKPADPNVYAFSINSSTGVLTQVGKFGTSSGNGPITLVVHPNGQFVYDFAVDKSIGNDGPLDGFSINTSTGALTPLAGSPFSSLTSPGSGQFDQSGTYLFFHAGSAIGEFNIDSSTGIPTEPVSPVGVGSGSVVYPWAVTDPL
jgi:hypothetical protein